MPPHQHQHMREEVKAPATLAGGNALLMLCSHKTNVSSQPACLWYCTGVCRRAQEKLLDTAWAMQQCQATRMMVEISSAPASATSNTTLAKTFNTDRHTPIVYIQPTSAPIRDQPTSWAAAEGNGHLPCPQALVVLLQQCLPGLDHLGGLLPVRRSTTNTTAWGDVHARVDHGHLGAHQRSRQHELIHVAQVPNAEHLSRTKGTDGATRVRRCSPRIKVRGLTTHP